MPQLATLRSVLEEARELLAAADNDFTWSSWQDRDDAFREIDALLADLRSGTLPSTLALHMLFAPTGPIQEVSLSSGWGDAMASEQLLPSENQQPEPRDACACFTAPSTHLIAVKELGLDSHLAEVSVLLCQECGQHWLRYLYAVEAFTGSGRWYLGPITPEQFATLTVEQAKAILEGLGWYYCGGSYYQGRTGRLSGTITLIS